jgi:hypothetical protein
MPNFLANGVAIAKVVLRISSHLPVEVSSGLFVFISSTVVTITFSRMTLLHGI